MVLNQSVSQEPLLGGQIEYSLQLTNPGATPVVDRGYNLTISDTLPLGLHFASADPAPSLVAPQANGTTLIYWDNIADLEAGESLGLSLAATLDSSLLIGTTFTNLAAAKLNRMPDNSGAWVGASSQQSAKPQSIDIEASALQSTAAHQAGGAGEYPAAPGARAGADWPYQYRLALKNNKVGSSANVVAKATLPPGVAYLGQPSIAPNPTNASATPVIALLPDGSLELSWSLGTLTTAQYAAPVAISFAAAIPYRLRTGADTAAAAGPYAGPMSGEVIPEDYALPLGYEATATYAQLATSDGSASTPGDDPPALVAADYLALAKKASPGTAGIGTSVTYTLDWYVSEYYSATNVLLTDVLPDGMTYVEGSASQAPASVLADTPGAGQTTLTWAIDGGATAAGAHGAISFQATVDPTYSAAPNAGAPVVSGDTLTNLVSSAGSWHDMLDAARNGALLRHEARASVATRMPTFAKQVWDAAAASWVHSTKAFTGDTLRFRLSYASAADVDARAIVIRDFLPRGMTFVEGSAQHSLAGTYTSGDDCASAPSAPTVGSLGGLQYLEWRLCNAARGSSWQATIEARIGDIPIVQPDWLVANFGKLSGLNTPGVAYSLRDLANVDYAAPSLTLTKTANPRTNLVAGSQISYSIVVKNNGRAPAYNLAVSDQVPANLLIGNSGGSASPAASSYTTVSGNPSAATGGLIRWANVASLAPGASQTFSYSASVPAGLPPGQQMTNLASVAYNSRADNAGHQWPATSAVADLNTDDETVYLRGMRIAKSATPARATIGDLVHWTLTATVPPGQVAYWPVIEENDLPPGFDYVPGSTLVSGAQLDSAHHAPNPIDDGVADLRWFLNTVDNTNGANQYDFTISFDTLVTGVKGNNPATTYYPNNCCLASARNTAYAGWYDTAGGYNNQGYAYHGLETNRITRRSPAATFDEIIHQPSLTLNLAVDHAAIGAGESVMFVLQASNWGNSDAHDLVLTDTLPLGLTFVGTQASAVRYPPGFPAVTTTFTDTNAPGATALSYSLSTLHVGASWSITMTAQVDPAISAALKLTDRARVTYSSKPGTRPDGNGDGLPDERFYASPQATAELSTPKATLLKEVQTPGELTYGAHLTYTLHVPAAPINATIYNLAITDVISPQLQVLSVSGGSASGNQVSANFASIAPNSQQTIVIEALLPAGSSARDGTVLSNRAGYSYTNGGSSYSNVVANPVVAPALVLDAQASQPTVAAGDTLTYTVRLANVGGGAANTVQLAGTLPANIFFVAGSAALNGAPLADLANGGWALPDLAASSAYTLTFRAQVLSAAAGAAYPASFAATGHDSQAALILANNIARVPADSDPDDQADARVYGPLAWQTDSTFVVFEDLKKAGWTDWDYNDLVVKLTFARGKLANGDLAALKVDYELMARGAGFNHTLFHQLPTLGGGWYSVTQRDAQGRQVRAQGGGVPGDDPTFMIIPDTRAALPPPAGKTQTNTWASQQNYIAGHRATLTVVFDNPADNAAADLPPLPWDLFIGVKETGQEVHLVMPGHLDNTQTVKNNFDATTPLRGYDLPLAQTFNTTWRWPLEYAGIWRGYGKFTRFIQSGNTSNKDWFLPANANASALWGGPIPSGAQPLTPADETPTSRYFGSPVAADLNGDGRSEIVIGNLLANRVEVYDAARHAMPGWPQAVGGGIRAAPAVADLDGDGKPEVLVGSEDGKLYAWHANGAPLAGWPVKVATGGSYRVLATPAVGDIDGDGQPEVVIALADGKLYALSAAGARKPGWPASLGDNADQYESQIVNSSPVLADLDGDGAREIVVGSTDKRLYVFNGDGTLRWSYPTGDMILGTPAVADIDAQRPGLEIAIGSGDSYATLLSSSGQRIWRRRTGWTVRSSPKLADLDGDGTPEVLLGSDDNKLYAWHADGSAVAGWPQATGAPIFSAPAFGDVDGDGQRDVVVGSDDGHVYAWHANGIPLLGWPKATSLAVKGAPAVVNLDADAAFEVVAGDMSGRLYVWNAITATFVPLAR